MKNLPLKFHFLFLLFILFFSSCCKSKKCQCNEKYGVKVNDCEPVHFGPHNLGVVKDYLYFKPGSWWVYKNNLSGETDSIYTVYCDTSVVNSNGQYLKWQSLTYTEISFRLRSDKYNVIYTYGERKYYPNATEDLLVHLLEKNADFATTSSNCTPFTFPFQKDNSNLFQELIPSLIIQGKTYTDVAVFQIWIDDTVQLPALGFGYDASSPTKYYWAKGVGLIQIEQTLYRSDTQKTFIHKWELMNYNLIK